jgi:hypothetical protein
VVSTGYGLQIDAGVTLNGFGGSITGDIVNAGTLNLVNGDSAGGLFITGNYTQSGTLLEGWGGMMAASHLNVSGQATLGGTLTLSFLDGFTPTPNGMPFTALMYGSRGGAFATLNLPGLSAGHWDPRYDDPWHTFTLWVVDDSGPGGPPGP